MLGKGRKGSSELLGNTKGKDEEFTLVTVMTTLGGGGEGRE